jgi:ABC-type transport system substrate-binding protein
VAALSDGTRPDGDQEGHARSEVLRPGPSRVTRLTAAIVLVVFAGGAILGSVRPARVAAAARNDVRIAAVPVDSLDPARQSDIATAAVVAQLYESLTAFDASLVLRPALAAGWDVSRDGRQVVFHLRPGLAFSDGSPLTAADVVGSWLRLIDPKAPSPLSSLMLDVKGARDRLTGRVSDPTGVGLRADGDDVIVDLERPGADFPAVVSGPSFGIVPPAAWRDGHAIGTSDPVVSGAYTVPRITPTELTLEANPHYWAGAPAIRTVHLVTDVGGRSAIAAFQAGDLDYVGISSIDAAWIAYDRELGPELRSVPSLSLTYLGFDTSRPPFDDVDVRRAFGAAVDWHRVAELGAFAGEVPADSMVPPGIRGAPEGDWLPHHDPDAARRLLADAGFPGGRGFPAVQLATAGGPTGGVAADLERELGVTVEEESISDHFDRLTSDPPPMWTLGWIADYPGPDDFLGVLLGTGSTNNYSRWSSAAFDAAIAEALSTQDPAATSAGFAKALGEVQKDVPAVPLSYSDSWALSRTGLLGADSNGLGIVRTAGMAWAPQ